MMVESPTSQQVELELKRALNMDQGSITSPVVCDEGVALVTCNAAKSQLGGASSTSCIPVEQTQGQVSQLQQKSKSKPIEKLQSSSAEVISSTSSESVISPRNMILQSSATSSSVPSSSSSCSLQQPEISHSNAGAKNQKKRTRKVKNKKISQSSLDNETAEHVTVDTPSSTRAATLHSSSATKFTQRGPQSKNAISMTKAAISSDSMVEKLSVAGDQAKSASVISVKELEKVHINLKTERRYASNVPENQLKTVVNKTNAPAEPRLVGSGNFDNKGARKSSITSISSKLSGVKLTEEEAVVGLSNMLSSNNSGARDFDWFELVVTDSSAQQSACANSTKGLLKSAEPTKTVLPNSTEDELKKKLQALEAEQIFLVKKKSPKQDSKYLCRLCDYHCIGFENCDKHLKDKRHIRLKLMKDEEVFLLQLMPPTLSHESAVTQCIMDLYSSISASETDYKVCEVAFVFLQLAVKRIEPTAVVTVYGSAVSGFMLVTSDLNIDITTNEAPRVLTDLVEQLKADKSGLYHDIVTDFSSEMPVINALVTYNNKSLPVNILVNNSAASSTSQLLSHYSRLDSRVQPLAVALRYWAKICKIDKQTEGTLPGYAYGLLVVYYLQQCKPSVLPVLHELLLPDEKQMCLNPADSEFVYLRDVQMVKERWKCENNSSVGQLWIGLLRFLCLELNISDVVVSIRQKAKLRRSEKKWTSKRLAIEDPFYRKRNIARSLSHGQIFEYIDDRLRAAYKYFAVLPQQDDSDSALNFQFNEDILGDSKGPAVICSVCQREGHLKSLCPQERLPPLLPLPPLTRKYINLLNPCLVIVPEDFEPRERDLRLRQSVLSELQGAIRKIYPKANLCLFGSSCNGFGFAHSDLDITLTFEGCPTSEGINCIQVIENLSKNLRKQHGLYNVVPITTAKVPIVKFKHARSQLEGDISLYNTLAQHNTRMLQTYALIDGRVKTLGYVMKVFAKCADICDASRGSLSSYAYVLMVIYYLQQCKPPVIPVLQELHGQRRPEQIVDKWNAWFFEDLKALPRAWPGLKMNQESVAELWIGLLRFYTEEFRFSEHVICIRRQAPLTKFEKLWNKFGIAIEDPFNLDHNLGSGLSRRMNIYIQKVLRKGRKLFGTPIDRPPKDYETLQDYFFDTSQLTDGSPPNDRCCRRCGKIGHFATECPQFSGNGNASKSRQQTQQRNDNEEYSSASKSSQQTNHHYEEYSSDIEERAETKNGRPLAAARLKSESKSLPGGKRSPAVASVPVVTSSKSKAAVPAAVNQVKSVVRGNTYVFNNSSLPQQQQVLPAHQLLSTVKIGSTSAVASYNPVVDRTMLYYVPIGSSLVPVVATQPCLAAPVAANMAAARPLHPPLISGPGVALSQYPVGQIPMLANQQANFAAAQQRINPSALISQAGSFAVAGGIPVISAAASVQAPIAALSLTSANLSNPISVGIPTTFLPQYQQFQQLGNPVMSKPESYVFPPMPVGALPVSSLQELQYPLTSAPNFLRAPSSETRTPVKSSSMTDQSVGSSIESSDAAYWQTCSSLSKTSSDDDWSSPGLRPIGNTDVSLASSSSLDVLSSAIDNSSLNEVS